MYAIFTLSTTTVKRKIIAISPENYQILSKMGFCGDSMNDVITKLIDYVHRYGAVPEANIPSDISHDDFFVISDSSNKQVSE